MNALLAELGAWNMALMLYRKVILSITEKYFEAMKHDMVEISSSGF